MLVKLHCHEYLEDYGLLVNHKSHPYIHFFDHGIVRLAKYLEPVQVVRVNAVWMDRDVKVNCTVADTEEKKKIGLQSYSYLAPEKGLYFPYPGYHDVSFYQGSVSYPLDILFLQDNSVSKIEENTKVGGTDTWSCKNCDGVIEVNGGFCKKNRVTPGDRLILFAFSQQDEDDLRYERSADNLVREMLKDVS